MTITINGTTGIAGVDGSASVPAFKGNDTDTGIFYPTANEVAAAAGGSAVWNASSTFGYKNRIINPGVTIDQWNLGLTITPTNNQFVADRYNFAATQASKVTTQASQVGPSGFTNSLLITSSSAYTPISTDYFLVRQKIEGYNIADLMWGSPSAKTVTLSFWVRSSLTGSFGASVFNAAGDRAYPFSYTVNSANTWEQKSVTIPGDTTGTWNATSAAGIQVSFNLGCGSNYLGTANAWTANFHLAPTGTTNLVATNGATLYITGIQFESGSVATSYDYRPIGTELLLCQRYFQTDYVMQQGTFGYFLSYYGGTNAVSPLSQNQVPMRAAPTASLSSTSIEYYSYSGVWTSTTLQIAAYSPSSFFAYAASDGDGRGKLIRTGSGGTDPAPYYLLNAEM